MHTARIIALNIVNINKEAVMGLEKKFRKRSLQITYFGIHFLFIVKCMYQHFALVAFKVKNVMGF